MSSLAAAKADNFYFPKDFDPDKHGSLNKYHGQHALRDRARKLKTEGILVIRFEVPFHIWCSKCGEKIAKGERFNADKKGIGFYHSTRIWQFSMRHHCGCIITIQSDPKRAEYIVVEGAKKKVEEYTAKDAEVMELADDEEKERLAKDPLYRLEQGEASRKRARSAAERVADLLDDADAKHADPYAANRRLRAQMRVVRKVEEGLEKERKALRLPEEIALLPGSEEDKVAASLAFYAHEGAHGAALHKDTSRKHIMSQSIFSQSAPTAKKPPGLPAPPPAQPPVRAVPAITPASNNTHSSHSHSHSHSNQGQGASGRSGGHAGGTSGAAGHAGSSGQQAGVGPGPSASGRPSSAPPARHAHAAGTSQHPHSGSKAAHHAGPGSAGPRQMPAPPALAAALSGAPKLGGGPAGQKAGAAGLGAAKTLKEKAALLAKRRKLQGVGLKLPERAPTF